MDKYGVDHDDDDDELKMHDAKVFFFLRRTVQFISSKELYT